MVGAEGFKLINLHLEAEGMSLGLWFIVLLIWFWNVLVGFVVDVWNLFLSMKFCILDSYCCMGRMTMELPLSADAIMALLAFSLIRIDFRLLISGCVFL
jgi:hypothetical protein